MTRAREAGVAAFLRKALAAEPLGVRKLNAMARAAGLLTERQRITDARVFRQAKTALGIQSMRHGFGPRGGWAWELPRNGEESAPSPSAIGPRLCRKERPIPGEWVQGVARLDQNRPPADVARHRWRQFVDDCNGFLNSPEADRAAQLGWHTMQLFGCKPRYPLSYLGEAGLLWHVNGGKIIELHRTWAVIDDPVNRSQRTFYRRNIAPEQTTLPWMLEVSPLVRTG
jgi:hypothetical protein